MMKIIETFLYRTFILDAAAKRLTQNVPARQRRKEALSTPARPRAQPGAKARAAYGPALVASREFVSSLPSGSRTNSMQRRYHAWGEKYDSMTQGLNRPPNDQNKRPRAIVENKRPGAALAFIREQQLRRGLERRSSKAPDRRDQHNPRLFKVG